ncbi:MAG: stage II sporulation protein M [Armatimonadota bacterium]
MLSDSEYRDGFERLEQILSKVEKSGLKSLSSEELLALGPLYRRVVSALSEARTHAVDDARIASLNHLASRAYSYIYVAEPKGWPSVRKFFSVEFPQTFRRNLHFIAVSFLISLLAMLFAYGVVSRDEGKAEVVFGPGALELIDQIAERHTGHRNWMPEEARPMMSSFIMANNIRVAAIAFAGGALVGLGTLWILYYNGLMLGVITAAIATRSPEVIQGFWAFVAPHGVIELPAIFISGGAGLMLGWAIICPGERTRADALKLAGREAGKLLLGVAAMLVVAGIIEGFFSPSMLPNQLKLAMALMLAFTEGAYLFRAGRSPQRQGGK